MVEIMEDKENAAPQSPPQAPRRLRKPPPVTPKRFTKFFTPRSSINRVSKPSSSKAGRQLREITHSGINARSSQPRRNRSPKKTVMFKDIQDLHDAATTPSMSSKKRKAYLSPESLPPDSSPCKRNCAVDTEDVNIPSSPPDFMHETHDIRTERSPSPELPLPPAHVQRIRSSNVSGRLLERSFGGLQITGRGKSRDNCVYWQAQTTDFYTRPEDSHTFGNSVLPWTVASCNTNSLAAIGDELGGIRIVDTASNCKNGFGATYLTLHPHSNALMDLAFSSDDSMLATASGDQTSRIIDMQTQKVKYVMHAHVCSVKQVRFQPDNDNVVVTSSRDGNIYIWDLRCKGSETIITQAIQPTELTPADQLTTTYKAYSASPYNSIQAAHTLRYSLLDSVAPATRDSGSKDSTVLTTNRDREVTVTSLAFLPSQGRSHLLISGSEAQTTLKLWDIRNRYSRRGPPTPISSTAEPHGHARHRHFGITSLVVNEQGSRIYALSKDNTVYTYSAAHLINGHAPELESSFSRTHQRSNAGGHSGLGPIYGFRHPKLHATTFFVRGSIRKARGDKSELLAVGSTDGCAVVFPTDESSFPKSLSPTSQSSLASHSYMPSSSAFPSSPLAFSRPALRRQGSSNFGARLVDSIPIHNVGTALVEGHSREMTDVTWTHDGDLVTLGDDYSARVWREGPEAREVRTATDGNAMKAGWGWAEVENGWDDDDC